MSDEEPWSVEGMTEEEARERWPDEPPRERRRRAALSVKAKERHAEVVDPDSGRRAFGGPQPGSGRPKRKRVAAAIAELAQTTRHKEVVDAMFSGLTDPSKAVRVRTATQITNIEHKERELEMAEERHEEKTPLQLLQELLPRLAESTAAGELPDPRGPRQPYDVEGTAVEQAEDKA